MSHSGKCENCGKPLAGYQSAGFCTDACHAEHEAFITRMGLNPPAFKIPTVIINRGAQK